MKTAEIHTNKGIMKINLYEAEAPITVDNFVTLAKKGYYDNTTFHRVIPDFMVQAGDPTGTGSGGPGYTIADEFSGGNQYHDRGVLSMANTGRPNTGGSQFFICHNRKGTQHLDGKHTCFGKVTEGIDIVDLIRKGDTIDKIVINESEVSA